ncbi:oligosaccharide flippase family protein [Ascidiaceihabitans sp.]|nr:oligosaccharide flippase family protein [Ascidiaceihabitans sp.]
MIKKIIEHRVFKNAVALMIIQMTQYVVPFLTLALLTRRLGVDSYSLLAFVMAIIQFANVVTDYGFYLSATEKLSRNRSWKNLVNHLLGSVIICKIFLYLVVSCVIIGFAFLNDQFESHKNIIILAIAPVLANTFLPTWFFQGMEKMKSIMWVAIASKASIVLTLLLVVQDPGDVGLVLWVNAIFNLTASLIAYFLIYKMGYYPAFSLKYIRYTAQYGFEYFVARISAASYTTSNGILLGLFVSIQAVGIYTIASQFYVGLHSIFVPIYHAIYPYMARERKSIFLFKVLCLVCGLLVFALPAAYFSFPYILDAITTPEFSGAIDIFNIMLCILLVNIISSFIGYPFFVAIGKNHIANYSIWVGATWHIVVLFILVKLEMITTINVTFVTLSSEAVIFIIRVIFVMKYYNIQKNFSNKIVNKK